MWRLLAFSTSTIVSIFLAAIALVAVAIYFPSFMNQMLGYCSQIKAWGLSYLQDSYGVWVNFLLEERTILYTFFIVIIRILFYILTSLIGLLFVRTA